MGVVMSLAAANGRVLAYWFLACASGEVLAFADDDRFAFQADPSAVCEFGQGLVHGFAWVGAFLLLFFVAELVSLFIKTGGAEGKKKKTQG